MSNLNYKLPTSATVGYQITKVIGTGFDRTLEARYSKTAIYDFDMEELLPVGISLDGITYSYYISSNSNIGGQLILGTLSSSGNILSIPVNSVSASGGIGSTPAIKVTMSSSNYEYTATIKVTIIDKDRIFGTVSMSDWVFGETPSEPAIGGTPADYDGEITVEYLAFGAGAPQDATPSTDKPTEVGYYKVIVTWSETDDYKSAEATNSFEIVREGTTTGTYVVIVTSDGNGTATANHSTAAAGMEIELTAEADSGYQFKEWQVVSGSAAIANNKFTMPGEDVAIKAIFEAKSTDPGTTPTRTPQIASANIHARATGNSIVLQNLPSNAKVEVFGLNGKLIYTGTSVGARLIAPVQVKGMYIVKITVGALHATPNVFRVAVK